MKICDNRIPYIRSTKKRLIMIQYIRNKLLPQGIFFLQQTHSTISNEVSWRDELNAILFFSHGSSTSCGVLIGFLGKFDVNVLNQMSDKKSCILILNITMDAKKFVSINLYNSNTETEQVEALTHF